MSWLFVNRVISLLHRWVIFNDQKVCASEKPPKDLGYLYFYRRVSEWEEQERFTRWRRSYVCANTNTQFIVTPHQALTGTLHNWQTCKYIPQECTNTVTLNRADVQIRRFFLLIRWYQTKGLFRAADLVCYLDDYAEKTPDITAFYSASRSFRKPAPWYKPPTSEGW